MAEWISSSAANTLYSFKQCSNPCRSLLQSFALISVTICKSLFCIANTKIPLSATFVSRYFVTTIRNLTNCQMFLFIHVCPRFRHKHCNEMEFFWVLTSDESNIDVSEPYRHRSACDWPVDRRWREGGGAPKWSPARGGRGHSTPWVIPRTRRKLASSFLIFSIRKPAVPAQQLLQQASVKELYNSWSQLTLN